MTKSKHTIDEVGESVAVIVNEIKHLSKNFEDFRNDTKKFCDNTTTKVNDLENEQIGIKTRQSNLTIFQTTLTLIIGAIAAFLGVKK